MRGVHGFAACLLCLAVVQEATSLDLVKDGKPAAVIVTPDEASETERKAAAVLSDYIAKASGAKLGIARESERPDGTLVFVGRTEAARQAGITTDGLVYDGYRLAVRQGRLFVVGRDGPRRPKMSPVMGAQGTWRAALALLERLGFRWVLPTPMGVHVPEMKTVAAPDDLDVTFNPPFMYAIGRMIGLGDWSMANNFRSALDIYTEGGHTWCTFVPASLWETHPEYFQMRNGQRVKPEGGGYFLCPSNPDVQKLLAEGLRKKFDEGYELVQLGQSDGYRPCECDACKALDKPGEIHEQVHVPHYSAIQMVHQTHPGKLVHLLIYPPTNVPSARIEKYPPNVAPEVCLTWTTAQAFVGKENFTREKLVRGHEAALKFWSAKMPAGLTVYVYYFGTYHSVGLAPKQSPAMIAEHIRRLHVHNVKGVYFCGGGENWGAEGPSYYVAGRLMNDPAQDWQPLVGEYCRVAFGPAAAVMREYYDTLYARIEAAPFTSPSASARFQVMFPPPVLDRLDGLLARAKQQAAGDARAKGWLRLADISHRHFSLLTRAYHAFDAYQEAPDRAALEKVKQPVLAYRAMCDEVLGMVKSEPAFVRDYFPAWGAWQVAPTNGGMGGANLNVPFKWNFDEFEKTGSLPGGACNAGFESTDIEVKRPSDWHVWPVGQTEANLIDTTVARTGKNSLHIKFDPAAGKGASYVVYQHVPRKYVAGKSYTYSCYVKTQDLKGSAYIAVLRYPLVPEDRQLIRCERVLKGTNDWTRLAVTFPVREGMAETSIRCHADGTQGEVWFDDVEFAEAAPAATPAAPARP